MFENGQIISKGLYEKFFIQSFFLIASLALFGFSTFGQDKTEDYKKIIVDSYEKLKSVSYRLECKKDISDGFAGISVTKIYEFAPPDNSSLRVNTEYFTDTGGANIDKPYKFQMIVVGEKLFAKKNEENWKKPDAATQELIDPIDIYIRLKDLSAPVNSLIIKQPYKTVINEQPIKIYEATYMEGKKTYEVRYWINPKGLLVKTEWKVDFKFRHLRMTETYEYDANIKIEAPKLN